MSDRPPAGLLKNNRAEDQEFSPDEKLYRRVPLALWSDWDDDIPLESVTLPDMSVNRSKYSHAVWARFNEKGEFAFAEWGVVSMEVKDIPPKFLQHGVWFFTFIASHQPIKYNYSHSEVRAYENGVHVALESEVDPAMHLRWRELLCRELKKVVPPRVEISIPDLCPE